MPGPLLQFWHLLRDTFRLWDKSNAPRLGAALSYYTTFSIAPVLVIATAIASLVFGREATEQRVSTELQGLMGATGAEAVQSALANAYLHGGGAIATIVGAVTLLIGATSVFHELQSALNTLWDAPPPTATGVVAIVRTRLLSFAMVVVVGFILLVSLAFNALLAGLGSRLGDVLPMSATTLSVLNVVVSFVGSSAMFGLLYKVLPDVHIPWSDVAVGAVFTGTFFLIGKQVIGLVIGHSATASAYGAAGSLAVFLVWVYYSAQIVLFGAQFTWVYANRHGSRATSPPRAAARIERPVGGGLRAEPEPPPAR